MGVGGGGDDPVPEDRVADRVPVFRPFIWRSHLLQWCEHKLVDEDDVVTQPQTRELIGLDVADGELTGSLVIEDYDSAKYNLSSTIVLSYQQKYFKASSLTPTRIGLDHETSPNSLLAGDVAISQTKRGGLVAVSLAEHLEDDMDEESRRLLDLEVLWRNPFFNEDHTTFVCPLLVVGSDKILCSFERLLFDSYTLDGWLDSESKAVAISGKEETTAASVVFRGLKAGHSVQCGFMLISVATGEILTERINPPTDDWGVQGTGFSTSALDSFDYTRIDGGSWTDPLVSDPDSYATAFINEQYGKNHRNQDYTGFTPTVGNPLQTSDVNVLNDALFSTDTSYELDPIPDSDSAVCEPYETRWGDGWIPVDGCFPHCVWPAGCREYHGTIWVWKVTRKARVSIQASSPLLSSHTDCCLLEDLIVFGPRQDYNQDYWGDRNAGGSVWTALRLNDLSTAWTRTVTDDGYRIPSRPTAIGDQVATRVFTAAGSNLYLIGSDGGIDSTISLPAGADYSEEIVAASDGLYLTSQSKLLKV